MWQEVTRVDSEEDNDPTPSTDVVMPEPDQGITVSSGDDARPSEYLYLPYLCYCL